MDKVWYSLTMAEYKIVQMNEHEAHVLNVVST